MTHEFNGKKYEEASTHQKEWGRRLVDELNLHGNERVLDLGCGDGAVTSQIAGSVPNGEVIGIDASAAMIDVALEKRRNNLAFMRMDIDAMNFRNEFDIIFSNATLHWVRDHESLLKNTRRALREEGKVRFNFAAHGNCSNFIRIVKQAMQRDGFRECFTDFEWPWYMPRPLEYEHFVRGIGFGEFDVWEENADRYFPDGDAMTKWIDQPSLVPFMERLSDRVKKEFRDYVVRRMIEATMDSSGRCFETFRRINLRARKSG